MTEEQRAAYVNAQAVCAQAEILGMQAENDQRKALGNSMAFVYEDFMKVIDKYVIDHNPVLGFFL